VGFPGETDDHVRELCDFLEESEFAHVGVFRYSHEENTAAGALADDVPDTVKAARWERVMATQARIAARVAAAQVGRTVDVLVERVEGTVAIGRTAQQAPEIDGLVRLVGARRDGRPPVPGDVVHARVTGADTYDLRACVVEGAR